MPVNKKFYSDCNAYFDYLRRRRKNDFGFEDEFYYTMPAVSSKSALD